MISADILRAEAPIDDCWNRIGIRGDQSCERLVEYIHCRNCPVHAQAAADLLDRIRVVPADASLNLTENAAQVVSALAPEAVNEGRSDDRSGAANAANLAAQEAFLLFRVADEWFGLAARFISQVANASVIHSLPRVRSKDVLGLTNVRGQLTVCVSLARLLDLPEGSPQNAAGASTRAHTPAASDAAGRSNALGAGGVAGRSNALGASGRANASHASGAGAVVGSVGSVGSVGTIGSVGSVTPRFIVARDIDSSAGRERRSEEVTVFPVDEVFGIERFSRAAHRVVPATLAHASAAHTRSLLAWKGRTVGVLDGSLLFETLRRSLG